MPFIETRDRTNLFYSEWGTGGQPVVFVHCWAAHSDMWEYQQLFLADRGFRCIAYDRRGHGRSDQPAQGYDYDTFADDLSALITQLDLRDVTLIGHSMGGAEVVRYLSRHGAERIARIVLLAPMTPLMQKTEDNPDGFDPNAVEATRAAWQQDRPKWLTDNARPFVIPETSAEMIRWFLDMMLESSLKVWIECNRAVVETDFRTELPAISVPTLIIHGDADASVSVELAGQKTAALIPGSRLIVYEGAPHGLFVTHVDRLNADLLAFLQEN